MGKISCRVLCVSLWLSNCASCTSTLAKPVARTVDRRLGIELAALRQHLWRHRGSALPSRHLLDEQPESLRQRTDILRWIDTTVMCADCLTKQMNLDDLQRVLNSNMWNFAQSREVNEMKARKQAQRRKMNDGDPGGDGDGDVAMNCHVCDGRRTA